MAILSLTSSTAATVRSLVLRRGLRQRDVAVALGLSQPAVSDRFRGRTPFRLDELERLAELLEVPVSELLQPRAAA